MAGRSELDAIAGAGATANRAVLFSGLAFVLAMSGMLLVPDSVLRSLGVGALTVGLVAVFAALTLVPALLGLLGDRVNALRIPIVGRVVESAGREGRFWSRIARAVMRRPVVSVVLSAGLLLAAAVPALDLRLSQPGLRSFPESAPARQGFAALEEEFGVGTVDSAIVVVEGDFGGSPELRDGGSGARRPRSARTRRSGTRSSRSARTSSWQWSRRWSTGDSRDQRAIDAVQRLRDRDVPAALRRPRRVGLRDGRDGRGDRLHGAHGDLASADHRVRPPAQLRPADDRVPLDRARRSRRSSSTCSRWARRTA